MSKKLVVCEKPSVSKSVAKVLGANNHKDGYYETDDSAQPGNGYIVSYCFGHLVGLADPEEYGTIFAEKPWKVENLPILPEKHGGWKFTVNKDTKKQFELLKKLMNSDEVTEIINSCDAGREGECIFRYVYLAANCKKPVKRLWVSSLEESAIRTGFDNLRPGSDYNNLYASGFARAKADFIVGMNLTRIESSLHRTFLSVGRVQTPTLAMIVERDGKIKNFIKERYFVVNLDCSDFIASSEKIDDLSETEKVKSACSGNPAAIKSIEREKKTVNPPKIYDLTTLQREANRLYGFTAQNTLDIMQSLYEKHKIVSYPRTDSQYLTAEMEDSTAAIIAVIIEKIPIYSGFSYTANISRVIKPEYVTDHHGIVPTAELAKFNLDSLSEDERKVFFMVCSKLLCATAEKHEYESVCATIECGGHSFTARGKTVIAYGWKAIERLFKGKNPDEEMSDKPLEIMENQIFSDTSCEIAEKWTSPPSHFTEDTLLSAMENAGNADYTEDFEGEKRGIGTPATRAATIETVIKRGYVERKKKSLICTEKGAALIEIIPESVKSARLTADWETALQKVAQGEKSEEEFMKNIENYTVDILEEIIGTVQANVASFQQTSIGVCPKCGGEVAANSKAYSCVKRCGFVIWKSIAKKAITEAQAKQLLEKGKTGKLKGFKSKAGKDFSAALCVGDDFTIKFDFS